MDIRANLELRIEEARRYQEEIETQLQQKIEEAAELSVRVANLEGKLFSGSTRNKAKCIAGELASEKAAARANAAESRAQVEQLNRQVEQATSSATQVTNPFP